ncbi:putative protein involved in protein-protein interaction, contains polyproline-binding GYF domain [Handroanthus impetiginosus]|uniref:OCRE domain-containing protein n=1 Tax=Handroanthus impetiginosus TaxID=429701 RepID=A0A2G9FY19_9LAMI|nr:putative protein involved in protein-protein interaction, contains polyproline-binding GYF domain [Handroanthus impetiginosus]
MTEGSSSRGNLKRPFFEDDESNKPPPEKRVRFPKGKKSKQGDYVTESVGEDIPSWKDPRLAARDRAIRRNTITAELLNDENNDLVPDIRKAEVQYKDNETFVEEGVTIEPFKLDKEREEGYFDESGNYVEYVNRNEIKDAWLENVDVQQKYTGKSSFPMSNDDKPSELTTEQLAEINRRIADVLEPGETVLRALRRLKGSTDKKQKMSTENKQQFDQLTDDAMKLMENGDYNVYDEKQEHFLREAEGYEKIVKTRKQGLSESTAEDKSDDIFDMFGDDDGSAAQDAASNGSGSFSVQPSESGNMQYDYVYDETSGYYYSSSLGYYYDPSSGLYCCAATGKWYSYNQELGTYDEVQQDASVASES